MPRIARARSPAAQSLGKRSTELAAPVADAFAGNHHAALSQDELNITQAETEEVIQPHGVADDLSREAVAVIQGWLRGHATSLVRLSLAG